MISVSHLLNQTIEIASAMINSYGQSVAGTYSSHVARIEYKRKAFRNKDGTETISEARIFLEPDVAIDYKSFVRFTDGNIDKTIINIVMPADGDGDIPFKVVYV